ncbi:hypothetical protein [Rhizobium sp. SG741]|uniref:hypothetical protein n=1 Tax=Rhizobium sp. SG741 TaxID=2587114 RepID=UPI0014461119|nr:hypothetical protein [Rhizobium sp. SG741]NKJ03147.1 hypothetical protein [Rhizobium sp. SG741]
MLKLKNIFFGILALCVVATSAHAQSATVSIDRLPTRTLTNIVGHDSAGLAGREPVTDFLKPGTTSPTLGDIACWGTSANIITDCGALGSMAHQNSNAVTITGGSITGITDLAIGDGGTGASTASGARTNLGLGTAATQNTGTSGTAIPFLDGANTWSGVQTFTSTSQANVFNTPAANTRGWQFNSSGSTRWIGGVTGGTESGGNVSSDLFFNRYSDAGTFIDTPLSITRSTGVVNINSLSLANVLPITSGGTGGGTAAAARSALSAAASGANSDITSLTGLATPLSIAQGGTAGATASAARTNLGLTSAATATATVGGSWTPVLAFGGSSTGITYSVQSGTYQRIGPLIYASFGITLTSKGSATGAATISGLPFATSSGGSLLIVSGSNFVTQSPTFGVIATGTTSVSIGVAGSTGPVALTDANFSATTSLTMSGIYTNGAF